MPSVRQDRFWQKSTRQKLRVLRYTASWASGMWDILNHTTPKILQKKASVTPASIKKLLNFLNVYSIENFKQPKLQQISWCGNVVETHTFRRVSGESHKTVQKLCVSITLPHHEIRWNNGILRCEFLMGRTTAQKMKFSIRDFFSKCDQIRVSQVFCVSHQLKKSLIESFIFCAVKVKSF